MKGEFHEDFQSDHADTLDLRTQDFDWAAVILELDKIREAVGDEAYSLAAEASVRMWQAIVGTSPVRPGFDTTIGRRFIATIWVIRPDLFGSTSLTRLANSIGLDKVELSKHAADASRRWGVRNRAQFHGSNFKPTTLTEKTTHKEDQDG